MRAQKSFSLLPMLLFCFSLAAAPLVVLGAEKNPLLQMFGIPSEENSAEMLRGLNEVNALILFSCEEVYPKPTASECIDRVKHGIGASFDPHSEYLSQAEAKIFNEDTKGAFGGLGIEIAKKNSGAPLMVINVIEDTPSERARLLSGDIISHIGEPGKKSVPAASLKDANAAVKLLRGTPGTSVNLKIVRKGVDNPINVTITREIITVVQIKGDLITSGGETYALIENKHFSVGNKDAMHAKYLELAKRADGKLSGLIVRLENNPGGLLDEVHKGVELFVGAQESIILTKSNEGIDVYTPLRHRDASLTHDITGGLPMLVVVNGGSASASEIFAGAMKHFGRAVIAGTSRTFGKGIVQSVYSASGGAKIKLTSSEYLIGSVTDWTPVQCVGIEPDILFEYPGIKNSPRMTECEMSGHVNTGGLMVDGPKHRPIKEVNPELYQAGEAMLEAYKAYILPRLLIEEEKRKSIESQ